MIDKSNRSGTVVAPGKLVTNGVDQCTIISTWPFPKTLLFLLNGHEPAEVEVGLINAVLNSYLSHGQTPASALLALLCADLGCEAKNMFPAVLTGALGKTHLGALEDSMKLQLELRLEESDTARCRKIDELLAEGVRIPGFGHRIHKVPDGDPRGVVLKQALRQSGLGTDFYQIVRLVEHRLAEHKPHAFLKANVDGVAAAALLTLGLPCQIASLIVALGRGADWYRMFMDRQNEFKGSHPRTRLETFSVRTGGSRGIHEVKI